MKKNKILVLGLVAAFVAVLSLTLVSGTWAKYTSTVTGSDEARVAKWAFKYNNSDMNLSQQNITLNLFDTINDTNDADETDVSDTLIAPGTKGTGTFTLQNTGEVTAKAKVTFTVTNEAGIPVVFKHKDGSVINPDAEGGNTYTLGEVTLGIGAAANEELALKWEWPFEVGTIDSEKVTNNTADTTLGIAGTAKLIVNVTVVFTQVD